jgi:hypothetical protein
MANESNQVIQRLFQRFFRDELSGLSAADRAACISLLSSCKRLLDPVHRRMKRRTVSATHV